MSTVFSVKTKGWIWIRVIDGSLTAKLIERDLSRLKMHASINYRIAYRQLKIRYFHLASTVPVPGLLFEY